MINKTALTALLKLSGVRRQRCKCPAMLGDTTQACPRVKKDLGKKWPLCQDLEDEWELGQMSRKESEQQVPPGPEENTWYIRTPEKKACLP